MKKLVLLSYALIAAGSLGANPITDRLFEILDTHMICLKVTVNEANQLLSRDADLCELRGGLALIHHATRHGKETYNTVFEIMGLKSISIDFPDGNGLTPLCHAALNGNPECVQCLSSLRASISYRVPGTGYTPLHFAVFSGNPNTVALLRSLGATEELDNHGATPSYYLRRASVDIPADKKILFEKREELLKALGTPVN